MEQLANFGINGSPDMMSEVLKAAASRMQFPCDETAARVKVSVQGWGAPVTLDVAGENLVELTGVAQAVGAKFTLEEVEVVDCFWDVDRSLRNIFRHMEDQKEMLAHTEFDYVWMTSPRAFLIFVFALLRVSKRWKVRNLVGYPGNRLSEFPTDVVDSGHIDRLQIIGKEVDDLDALKRIWEISEKVIIKEGGQAASSTLGGGRGENSDADWQRLPDIIGPNEDNNNNND